MEHAILIAALVVFQIASMLVAFFLGRWCGREAALRDVFKPLNSAWNKIRIEGNDNAR